MIKIEHPNLSTIARKYADKIILRCQERAAFYIKVINVLQSTALPATLLADPLNGATKKSLINLMLYRNKLKNQTQYGQTAKKNCFAWVYTQLAVLRAIAHYLENAVNVEKLVLVGPTDALNEQAVFENAVGITPANRMVVRDYVAKIMDYDMFGNYAYNIAADLGINTCPYCNRSTIHTVIDNSKGGVIRPTFDHFFSKESNPVLSISFYNLIPSCYYCNSSLKGRTQLRLDTHLHPYMDGFGDDISFHVLISDVLPDKSHPSNYRLVLQNNMTVGSSKFRQTYWDLSPAVTEKRGNLNLFRLCDIYQSHLDTVGELIVKCDTYSKGYVKSLGGFFGLLETNKEEFYRFYFGNYFNTKDFHRRPLAKLSKDIIKKNLPFFT